MVDPALETMIVATPAAIFKARGFKKGKGKYLTFFGLGGKHYFCLSKTLLKLFTPV